MTTPLLLSGRVTTVGGGLPVRRLLPDLTRRAVGPFVFFDHFGPVLLPPDADADVGPHPHIGLATVTYLFEGGFLHRDSLGTVQTIVPGAVNWMTAGRGIVHSERVPDADRGQPRRLHGLQLWVALPPAAETTAPSFQHVPAADLPAWSPAPGVQLRLMVGDAMGYRSPVRAASPTLYLDVQLAPHTTWTLPPLAQEMALYAPDHAFTCDGQPIAAALMAVLPDHSSAATSTGADATLSSGAQGTRLVVIGGAPLEQPVRLWWNFVSTDRARIRDAAALWAADGFDAIPGEAERLTAPPWRD